jgi:hypothetical protein
MADQPVAKEIAYYYPNPMWRHGDWVKSLIVFFDGVALLVPEYMKEKPELVDPAIVAGLNEQFAAHSSTGTGSRCDSHRTIGDCAHGHYHFRSS